MFQFIIMAYNLIRNRKSENLIVFEISVSILQVNIYSLNVGCWPFPSTSILQQSYLQSKSKSYRLICTLILKNR